MDRTLLLVDDEQNILSALTRLLRRDGYRLLTASGGEAGLAVLAENEVGVIISDQRMPGMSGSEFLNTVKERHPDTVRIMLSGYTDLASVTEAINRGAIYKFLTKPWEDDLLRENVREAFHRFELARENERLTKELTQANERLADINMGLRREVEATSREAADQAIVLNVAQEVLDALPIGVLGIGDEGLIAVANGAANRLLAGVTGGSLLGAFAEDCLPPALLACLPRSADSAADVSAELDMGAEGRWEIRSNRLGMASEAKGRTVVLIPKERV